MTSLRDMNERMQQWMNEKPGFSSSEEYRPLTGDLVIFNFVSSGNDGDQFIKVYKAHVLDTISKNGKRYGTQRFCPVQSGETGLECPYCAQGHTNIKERMSMWFYVQNILHAIMPRDTNFPPAQYEGRTYFNEEVMDFKRWDTSAWRESPWNDILKNFELYKGLHNFSAQLSVVGENLARRYKIYVLPQSQSFPPELYEQAKQELETIPNWLRNQLASPVQIAPPQVQGQQPTHFGGGGTNFQAVTPFRPGPTPAFTPQPTFTAPAQQEQPPQEPPEEDNRRPMKSMF